MCYSGTMTKPSTPSELPDRPIFIVKLWWEPGNHKAPSGAGEWRGSVELLASAKRHYFRDLSEVGKIIAAVLGGSFSTPSSPKE